MLKTTALTIFLICLGCQTTKEPSTINSFSRTEAVAITVTQYVNSYTVEAKWTSINVERNKLDSSESTDVLSSPKVTGSPNKWMQVKISTSPKGCSSKTRFLIDDEIVEIDSYPGINLIVKVIPQNNGLIQAKGIFVASSAGTNKTFASTPFNIICKPNESKTIYEKELKFMPTN